MVEVFYHAIKAQPHLGVCMDCHCPTGSCTRPCASGRPNPSERSLECRGNRVDALPPPSLHSSLASLPSCPLGVWRKYYPSQEQHVLRIRPSDRFLLEHNVILFQASSQEHRWDGGGGGVHRCRNKAQSCRKQVQGFSNSPTSSYFSTDISRFLPVPCCPVMGYIPFLRTTDSDQIFQ